MSIFNKIFRKDHKERIPISFKEKLNNFQSLLNSNDEALKLMGELGDVLNSGLPFTRGEVLQKFNGILQNTIQVADHLSIMCEGKYQSLVTQVYKINDQCSRLLAPKLLCPESWDCPELDCINCEEIENIQPDRPYSYHINEITINNSMEVGGKMSHLCEVHNKLGIPIPDGFCLTARCFEEFLSVKEINIKIEEALSSIDFNNNEQIQQASWVIQTMIVTAVVPDIIEKVIWENYEVLAKNSGNVLLSVRSSAVGEDDPHYSFAGLHYTALNVSKANLIDACIEVLISKYLPQSLVYRYINGLRDVDMPMSTGIMVMINAEVSGVLFSKDPMNVKDGIIIQAVRGLGTKVVDGSVTPQEFIIDRSDDCKVIDFKAGNQKYKTSPRNMDGLHEVKLSDNDSIQPCLNHDQIRIIVNYALHIENYYNTPQDIEWAIDKSGKVYILQCRALSVSESKAIKISKGFSSKELESKYTLLLNEGECASPGIASGEVFLLKRFKDIVNFPSGGILVTKKTSPELTRILHKAAGLITDVGSTTGHLAIIARELGVPVIVNTNKSTEILSPGMKVTINADDRKIYNGEVPELLTKSKNDFSVKKIFSKSPIYRIWQNITKLVIPLNLADPESSGFTVENCKTFHDITRFAHEYAMREMFALYESAHHEDKHSYHLKFQVPLNIYIIDIGNGLKVIEGKKFVIPEDIISRPFNALIKGMTSPGIRWAGPLPIDLKGLTNLLMSNVVDSNRSDRDLGSRSYAIISDKYMNFFSRLGYHFSRLDAYASDEINNNYINFHFRGGAADPIRRMRRAKIITKVLETLNFSVSLQNDNVLGTIRKIPSSSIFSILTEIGRLMGAVRNVDVTLTSDENVGLFVDAFLKGDSSPALKFTEDDND